MVSGLLFSDGLAKQPAAERAEAKNLAPGAWSQMCAVGTPPPKPSPLPPCDMVGSALTGSWSQELELGIEL